jgi:hypothetical protein
MLGWEVRVCLWWRLTSGMRSAVSFDRPTCYPCPALPGAAHIMPLYEHVEASERTQSTGRGECPRAKPGARRLPKPLFGRSLLA